ncbi:MAG: transcriptional regulator [Gemmatales bacterium]|nr:MAG: transcriptional regulator [Gemmatales bacterium]
MQFEALKVFCDVARQRSFSRAARANGKTQSAVSQIVHELEARLQVKLIDRSTRPLQLTEAGKIYFEGCQGLVEQYLELEASIRNTREERARHVQVAAIYSVGLGDMGQCIDRFKALQPNVHVHIEYLHPERVVEKVLDGEAEIGLVSFPRSTRHLTALPWRQEEMVVACAPSHPLAHHKTIRTSQLEGEKFVGFDKNLTIRREVDRFLRSRNTSVVVELEFDNIENIKKAVEYGAGVALLPMPTLQIETKAGTLRAVRLNDGPFYRPLGIIHQRHHRLSPMAQRFIELLQSEADRQENGTTGNGAPSSAKRRKRKTTAK